VWSNFYELHNEEGISNANVNLNTSGEGIQFEAKSGVQTRTFSMPIVFGNLSQ
jgi:hypothetical protein